MQKIATKLLAGAKNIVIVTNFRILAPLASNPKNIPAGCSLHIWFCHLQIQQRDADSRDHTIASHDQVMSVSSIGGFNSERETERERERERERGRSGMERGQVLHDDNDGQHCIYVTP